MAQTLYLCLGMVGGLLALGVQAQVPAPPTYYVRCENVLPEALRKKLFTGWTEEERSSCPECPTTCAFRHARSRSEASVSYVYGGPEDTDAQMREAKPRDGVEIPRLGRYAYQYTEEDGSSEVDVWDDDSPCLLVTRWNGKDQATQVRDLARAAVAAATQENVTRPVQEAIIWAGARSAEDAQTLKSRWEQARDAVHRLVQLAPGYPQLVESKDVVGLKPGFHVLLLGYCNVVDDTPVLERLQEMNPGSYSRRVELPPENLACPRPIEGVKRLEARTVLVGGKKLNVGLYKQPAPEHKVQLALIASLIDASGSLVASSAPEPIVVFAGTLPPDNPPCVHKLTTTAGGIVVESVCTWNPAGCRGDGVDWYTHSFRVEAGTLLMKREHTGKKPDCSTGD